MAASHKQQLEQQAILAARSYGTSTTLFRSAVGLRLGVNVTDMECLALLFFKRTATPTELSTHTGLTSGATTAMLDRLQRAGLILRRANPNDHRGSLVMVSPAAQPVIAPLFTAVRDAQLELLATYSEDDLALVVDFLHSLSGVWERGRQALPQRQAHPDTPLASTRTWVHNDNTKQEVPLWQ